VRRETCFVDTSAFYALIDADDFHHEECVALFTDLARSRARLLTSNHVVFETYSLILNRLGRHMAIRWLTKLNLHVERATVEDERRAAHIVVKYRDKGFSLVDASSFALMERLGLRHAIAFDPHFRQYGRFVVLPRLTTHPPSRRS
jgi:predicted nucleic acid-binding protein